LINYFKEISIYIERFANGTQVLFPESAAKYRPLPENDTRVLKF
jgi:hypothetical protein